MNASMIGLCRIVKMIGGRGKVSLVVLKYVAVTLRGT